MAFSEDSYQAAFLQQGLDYYQKQEVLAQLHGPTEEAPYNSLIIRLDEIGTANDYVDLEISFVHGLQEAAQEGIYLLQSFTVLATSLDQAKMPALLLEVAKINTTLPLGAFGVFQEEGVLYYKYNTLLHRKSLVGEEATLQLDRQNGLILHQLHLYFDHLTGLN